MSRKFIILLVFGLMITGASQAQQPVDEQLLASAETDEMLLPEDSLTEEAVADTTVKKFTARKILEDCKHFKYPLLGILFAGLFLGLFHAGILFMEQRKSQPLAKMSFQRASSVEIETELKSKAGASELGHLLRLLFTLHKAGNGTEEDFHNEVAHAAKTRQERFGTFRNWMIFLSDSAGALGLLGTVMGMYSTFWGGALDAVQVVSGMGIALSTTLVGIVISIALNLVATLLSNYFDRQMELTYNKAEELRFALKSGAMKAKLSAAATGGQS